VGYSIGSVVRVVIIFRSLSGIPTDPTAVTIKARNPLNGITVVGVPATDPITIASLSNALSLPQSTIYANSIPVDGTGTTYLPPKGIITVATSGGNQTVAYTSVTPGDPSNPGVFQGCTGGTGAMSTGGSITPVGVWHADFSPTVSGRWAYSYAGTGAVTTAGHGEFNVDVQEIP
jgi:hypothetical protein